MQIPGEQFLTEVLGEAGAKALRKASEHYPDLGKALLPRSILSWLSVQSRVTDTYDSSIPGVEGTKFTFSKSEKGFSGQVTVPGGLYEFTDATMFHVAGALAVALEADLDATSRVRDIDVERLGKSIDLLAKAHLVNRNPEASETWKLMHTHEQNASKAGKGGPWKVAYNKHRQTKGIRESLDAATQETGLEKVEATGPAAKPVGAVQPALPQAPKAAATAAPRAPGGAGGGAKKAGGAAGLGTLKSEKKLPGIRLRKSEIGKLCQVCGKGSFQDGHFCGCMCFSSLAKGVAVSFIGEQIQLDFGEGWNREGILTLSETWGS